MSESTTNRPAGRVALRAGFLVAVVLVLFGGLLFRYFDLMVLRHEEFLAMARDQSRRTEELRAFRGSILDRSGRDLALTRAVPSVAVDPSRVAPEDRARFARDVATVLNLDPADVLAEVSRDAEFRWLRRQVRDPGAVPRLKDLGWGDAIIVREELARCYPNGAAASPVLGLTNVDGRGLFGLEARLDDVLAPRPGSRVVLRDGWTSRRISSTPPDAVVPSEDGEDVTLSLELAIQTFAEEALDAACAEWTPKAAVAVVMDPRNGDVLALASRPTFDPEDRSTLEKENRRVRAVTDAYPPGSTMKPLVAAAALDEGVISFDETFDCTTSGLWRYRGRLVHDHGRGIGVVPFPQVLIQSSNIGAAQIALKLGIPRMQSLLHVLGFDERTGCGLPDESSGLLTRPEEWTEPYTLCSVGFGQEMAVTPLQFTAAFAALVNGGILYRPRIVLRVGDREVPVQARRQVYSPDVVRRLVVPTLVRVVEEGTGTSARIPGYLVGGKTGTAQRIGKNARFLGYVSSFAGFAPADDPRFLVFVLLDTPSREKGTPYGGRCAAPAAREILSRCLRYAEIPPVEPVTRRGN